MKALERSRRAGVHSVWLRSALFCVTALAACSRDSTEPAPTSVCPACKPVAGGETTSFARGDLSACFQIYRGTKLSAERAAAQGFAVRDAQQRLERSFDAPLRWLAQQSENGSPAKGYRVETRVKIHTTIVGYTAIGPDPAICDQVPCTYAGESCVNWLQLDLRVGIETLDGAVRGTLTGGTAMGLAADGPFNSELIVDASLGLKQVVGSLQLFPSLPEPYAGALAIEFPADGSRGDLWIIVAPPEPNSDTDAGFTQPNDVLWGENVSYQPLRGVWSLTGEFPGDAGAEVTDGHDD